MELTDLLPDPRLPDTALRAAAAHADLAVPLARAPHLPDDVFTALWDGPAARDVAAAEELADHVTTAARRHHVLVVRDERRPEVLGRVLPTVVPTRRWRRDRDDLLHGLPARAALWNPRWPVAEQPALVARVPGPDALAWAATADPDDTRLRGAATALASSRPDPDDRWRLPTATVREAVLRWPSAAELALAPRGGDEGAGDLATVTDDDALLDHLVDRAEEATNPFDGPPLVEALWCNPSLPRPARRRLERVVARGRVACHYVRPVPEATGASDPVTAWSRGRLDEVLTWAERARDVRHLSVWTVGLVAARRDLPTDLGQRAARLLATDAVAAGLSWETLTWLGRRHGWASPPRPSAPPLPSGSRRDPRPAPGIGALVAGLEDDHGAWEVAIALLRDGWQASAELLCQTVRAIVAPTAEVPHAA